MRTLTGLRSRVIGHLPQPRRLPLELSGAVDGTIGSGRLDITDFRVVGGRRSTGRQRHAHLERTSAAPDRTRAGGRAGASADTGARGTWNFRAA